MIEGIFRLQEDYLVDREVKTNSPQPTEWYIKEISICTNGKITWKEYDRIALVALILTYHRVESVAEFQIYVISNLKRPWLRKYDKTC